MARMVPSALPSTDSRAEQDLFRWFDEQLSDEYVVYHGRRFTVRQDPGPFLEREADFIVAHPADGILVIEAKSGVIAFDPVTSEWSQGEGAASHVLAEDPFAQAQAESHALLSVLKRLPGWRTRWMPSVGHAVAFPDGLYPKAAHQGAPVELVIDRDDVRRLNVKIPEIMRSWHRQGQEFGQEGMDALADALGVAVTTRVPLQVLWEEDRKEFRKLTLTAGQLWTRDVVLSRRRAVVRGAAGSGKTVLAMSIAKDLARSGQRTLLTCFNAALGAYLREATKDVEGLDVVHFHRLCYVLAEEAGLPLAPVAELTENAAYFEEELPNLLEQAARTIGRRYDAIVVDEAQDFKEWWWPALLSLHADPDDGRLYLFADSSQNLYAGGSLPVGPGDEIPPLPSNLRNTQAINSFVSAFYEGPGKMVALGPQGQPIEIHGYDATDDLARSVGEIVRRLTEDEGMRLRDIVLLTPSRRAKSELRSRTDVGGIPLVDLQDLLRQPQSEGQARPTGLLTATIHKFKGLEAPVVILAEIGEKHAAEDQGVYLYVGASRASSHLIVLAKRPVDRQLSSLADRAGRH